VVFLDFFGGKKETKPPRPTKLNIGAPKNFSHVSGFGFNSKEGFKKIPDEWMDIFKKAGVSETELKDKKTAKFLLKTIIAVDDPEFKKKHLEAEEKKRSFK